MAINKGHLRLVKSPDSEVFAYDNRHGHRYYLHEGKTKTGKRRFFFARTVREGAVARMPDGCEVTESINGVVSVRKKQPGELAVPAADVKLVEAALARGEHLRFHKVRVERNAIVIFEPDTRPDQLRTIAERVGIRGLTTRYIEERMQSSRYSPVMKFEQEGTRYVAYRMTYRGRGGWSWPLATGALDELVKTLVPSIGTDEFFELL